MKKHIPNSITALNLFTGCVGVVLAFRGELESAAYCVLLSGVFDFFDGMVARLLRVSSPIGKQLDSLADVISFGLLPGVVLYQMMKVAVPQHELMPFAGFIVTVFSALRLAKFNIDERQTVDFIGLNTPMNTFFVVSLPFLANYYQDLIYSPYFLLSCIVICSALLVSEVRLFSMKLNGFSWKENSLKFTFVIIAAALIAFFQFAAIPLVLVLYFVFSYLYFRRKAD